MARKVLCGLILALSSLTLAQLTPTERQGLTDALYVGNLSLTDLEATRTPSKLKFAQAILNRPLDGLAEVMKLNELATQRNIAQLLGYVNEQVLESNFKPAGEPRPEFEVPLEVPEKLRPSVKRLVSEILIANNLVRGASEKLTPEERRTLIEALPRMAVQSPAVKFEFVKQPLPPEATIKALLAKVDFSMIQFAAVNLAKAVQDELAKLKEAIAQSPIPETLKLNINGVVVELSGTGDDRHDSTDAVLCIDLGGDDKYTGRYGAGVGYSSVLIDLGGDDHYDLPDLSVGAAVLGVGLAFDLGGTDSFRGKSLCFGAGIGGVGAMLKDGGDDFYRSTSLAQGFGYYGIGLLLDTKGVDQYQIGAYGQGSARTKGVGWLLDKSGSDTYRSGGLVPDSKLGQYQSSAQGSGFGEDCVGIITDLAGDDAYLSDSRSIGFGKSGGIGLLQDNAGRDIYASDHDSQGAGMQSGAGYLIDLTGDDTYSLRLGNGHGFGHDLGVGLLLDRQGDDLYSGLDSRPGTANANGLALFLDSEGDDRYPGSSGVGNPARGTGSLAVFADLGGNDAYSEGLANGSARADSSWGVALDSLASGAKTNGQETELPKPGSKPMPAEPEMEILYTRAKINDEKALDELIAIGENAVKWLVDRKLSESAESVSILSWVARQVGGTSESLIVAEVLSKDDARAKAAIQICQEAGFTSATANLLEAFKRPSLVSVAARAAGSFEAKEFTQLLLDLASGSDPNLARIAIISLAQIGDERSYVFLEAKLGSQDLPIRKAAITLVAKFPTRAMPTVMALLKGSSERDARTGIEVLSLIGSESALAEIGKLLSDGRRGVLIQSLSALDGRCPKEFWGTMIELRQSGDPLVKAVANRVEKGR